MLKIKVNGASIKNLTDARYFAAREAESLGFCLDEGNESYIAPLTVKAIKEWVEGPQIIGEFGLQSTEEIIAAIQAIGLDAVQLNFFSAADRSSLGVPIIQEIIVERHSTYVNLLPTLAHLEQGTSFFLLDLGKNNITWQEVMRSTLLEILQRLCQKYKIWLNIPCEASEIEAILKIINPYGLSLKGGAEERIGVKSFDELDAIFDVLEC